MRRYTILVLILFSCIGENTETHYNKEKSIDESWRIQIDPNVLYSREDYEMLKSKVKLWEGFVSSVYLCPANKPSIGYGHRVYNREDFDNDITLWQADSILDVDLKKVLVHVNRLTDCTGKRLLALTSFCFNIGYGNYENSVLHKEFVLEGRVLGLENQWVKYSHYKKDRKIVHSKALMKRRIWELNFYKESTYNQ